MQMNVIWWSGGALPRILSDVFKLLLRVSLLRPAVRFGSYLGGVRQLSRGGYLVRDDQPRLTSSARTVAVPRPGWTSH